MSRTQTRALLVALRAGGYSTLEAAQLLEIPLKEAIELSREASAEIQIQKDFLTLKQNAETWQSDKSAQPKQPR